MRVMPGMAPAGPPAATQPTGPSPGMMPQQEGLVAQARVKMSNAARELIGALGVMKTVGTEEGKACLDALKALQKVIPDVQEGVGQSEIASMMQQAQAVRPAPGVGGGGMLGMPRPQPQVIAGGPMGGMR